MQLFERQKGRLVRKPETMHFFHEIEEILERLARASQTMKDIAGLQEGHLRIACMPASSLDLIPSLVSEFVKDKPQIKVSMMTRSSCTIEEWIASQQYDIGLSETPAHNHALEVETFELSCVCALRRDNPLSQKAFITPKDLSGLPLATLNEEHPNLIATKKAFAEQNCDLNMRFELRNFHPALKLVEDGLCYCICDPLTEQGYLQDKNNDQILVFRPFIPKITLSVSIIQPAQRGKSLLSEEFSQMLSNKLKGMVH